MLGIILDIAKCMAMFSRKCICYVWYDKDTHKVGSLGLQVEGRCTQYCTNAGCKSCNNDLILTCWVECRVFLGSDDCGGEFGECDGEEKREKKKYRLE